jgi:tetratricopeptide (TPR) repeat protein
MKKKVLIISSIVVAVLLLVGGIFAYLQLRPPTAEEITRYEKILSEGDLLFEAQEYSEAVAKYNDAVKVIRTDGRAYSRMVDIYLLKNDFDTAQQIAQKAQNSITASQASLIYADIAERYLQLDDFYNTRMNYEIAASLNSNPKVNLGLAKAYIYNDEFGLSKKLLEKEYDSETVDEAKLLYAYILGTEDIEKAKKVLSDYTVSDSNMNSHFEEYNSVLDSLTEDELFNITKLSRVYVNRGYPNLAIRILEPKIEEITEYVDALYFLGKAYLDTKQYDNAVDTLSKSAGLIGYESHKYWMLARAYYYKDDLVNAMSYYDMAVGYAGDDMSRELVEEYLDILLDSNQANKAQEVFTNIVKTVETEWLYLIGLELYHQLDNGAKFDYYLDKLVSMEMGDSQQKEYLFWKIRRNLDTSETENTEQDLEQLLALDRFNPRYYWLKGLYEISLSDTGAARNSLELALEYDLEGEVTQEVEDLLAQL